MGKGIVAKFMNLTPEPLIREEFPADVTFEVTDIESMPKGDPFLRVRVKNTEESFIIEWWDEPKFRS